VFIFHKLIDRIPLKALGFDFHSRGAFSGFFLAAAMLGTGSMILLLTGHLQWVNYNNNWKELFNLFMLMMVIAISEELAFRGYILGNLLKSFSRKPAILLSAAGFVFMHIANPGMEVMPTINLMLGGILLGQCYAIDRNLWMPVLFHFGWNFMQGPILGFNVSGLQLDRMLEQELSDNVWMTGGEFGFEGSLVATVILIVAIGILELRFRHKIKN
jgi:membrane protease YdiL (CAAX protease family)